MVTKSAKPRRKFDQNDGVMCRSVTKGLLNLIGQKTGIPYKWFDYGDRSEVEYRDLVAEVRSHGASVFDPRFIIEDEDFLAEFPQVVDFYNENCNIRDLDAILQMAPDKMREALLQLPKSTYPNIKILASALASSDSGTCTAIWSPSKSALYGGHTQRFNLKVLYGSTLTS